MGVAAFIAKRDNLFRLGCISMANKNEQFTEEEAPLKDYYDLKTDAVDRLLNAKNAPVVSEKEIKQYKGGWKRTIPTWVKIVFVKFWFGGAICYFFVWGLGMYLQNLDLMAALAIGLGACTDLLVNNLLKFLEPEKGDYDKWMMVTVRKFWSIFLNVLYAAVLLFFIVQTYVFINQMITGTDAANAQSVPIGVEPIFFGLLYMGYDMLFIFIKNMVKKAFRDAEAKVSNSKR